MVIKFCKCYHRVQNFRILARQEVSEKFRTWKEKRVKKQIKHKINLLRNKISFHFQESYAIFEISMLVCVRGYKAKEMPSNLKGGFRQLEQLVKHMAWSVTYRSWRRWPSPATDKRRRISQSSRRGRNYRKIRDQYCLHTISFISYRTIWYLIFIEVFYSLIGAIIWNKRPSVMWSFNLCVGKI